ncbi:RNA polymerase sigma factor [Pedobacter sp. R20-19]|uniref:RNA polymerase sigma factor n=1 Tax=Pedobacter sp. R20-19 TaxID=1270196 RepID=UPI0004939217|nr:sigma-70 family RNA polymerase sigma factor [Pedobacter sp. R20-19]
MAVQDDQNLISEILRGNRELFGVLIKKYQKLVFTVAYRIIKDEDESKDVSQDVFIKAFQNLKKFNGDAKFSTWISTIAFRQSFDYLKKKQKRSSSLDNWNNSDYDINSDSLIEIKERKIFIQKAIDLLKPEDSIIVTLYYLEEKSLNEISEITGITINNLKARLFKSRKMLKDIFKRVDKTEINEFYER